MKPDGANLFSLEPEFELNEIRFSSSSALKYKCFTDMTPLDCLYQDEEKNTDEFYDGTGNLVWLAALGFGHALDENCANIQKYLGQNICELGCGTGVAGIAALLFSKETIRSSHVLFTDNDRESLDLCHRNCALNHSWLEEHRYSQQILSWGEPSTYPTTDDASSNMVMDTILATDVLYDMAMIPPLMETVSTLLMEGGYSLLSHVPRFCLPKRHQQWDDKVEESSREEEIKEETDPFRLLEMHILEQAKKVGLELVETIRLHETLTTLPRTKKEVESLSSQNNNNLSLERLEEMHAALFVFQKKNSG